MQTLEKQQLTKREYGTKADYIYIPVFIYKLCNYSISVLLWCKLSKCFFSFHHILLLAIMPFDV